MSLPFENVDPRLGESGLFTQAELREFVESLPEEKRPRDSDSLLQALVREKRLTTYQAKEIGAGRGNSLVFGNYVVLDKLGQGGMGVVYKAQHLRMQRVVALKVLSPGVTRDPEAIRRFQREVVAAARLVHPNIVTAYDADEAKGTHFLVMEYVAGKNLSQIVRETGPLSVRQSVWCLVQAAQGLEFAHQHGVVHRDVKPANLLFDTEGKVKVLDLGLARMDALGNQQAADLTSTGDVMGTVDFMAPEQAEDTKLADARSDVYSLGMTLWYLITGRMCFERDSLASKIVAHRNAPIPSLRESRPDASVSLDEIFQKLAAKDPRDRYQSMAEAILALEGCLKELGEATRAMNDENELTVRLASLTPREDETVVFFKPNESTRRNEGLDATVQLPGTTRVSKAAPETRRDRLPLAMLLAFLGGAAMILLTVVLLLPKGGGNVLIEVTDPEVKLTIDKGAVSIVGVVKQKLSLTAGEHDLEVTRGATELSEKFTVGKGKSTTLAIDVVDGVLQVKQDGKLLGSVALVPPAVDQPPPKEARHVLEFSPGSKVEIGSLQLDRTGALTLEAYVTAADSPDAKSGVLLGTPQQFAVHLDPKTNRLSLESKHENGEHVVGPLEIAPGRRTHVAAVRSEQEHRLYIEGILVGRKKIDSPLVETSAPVTIGGNFAGTVEEIRVSRAARYDEGFTPAKRFEADGETLALFHAVEGKGEKLEDASGNNHAGTIMGAKWEKTDSSGALTPVSQHNWALRFDGKTSHVVIPTLEFKDDEPLTLELWATCHDDLDIMIALAIFGKDNALCLSTGNKNWGASRFAGDNLSGSLKWGAVRPLQKLHVAGVWNGQSLRCFIDGKEASFPFEGSLKRPTSGASLGALPNVENDSKPIFLFSGLLDEIRISTSARYDKDFIPVARFEPDAETLALYHCDEGSGQVLVDSSGKNHHGQILDATWVRSDESRNLLFTLDPAKDGLVHDPADNIWKPGQWQLTPEGLKSGSGRREIFRLPVKSLPANYSLLVEFELAEGNGSLLGAFTVGASQCYLVVNGSVKGDQRLSGFGEVDGRFDHMNETTVQHAPCIPGERHVLQVDVRSSADDAELVARLDEKHLTAFKGKASRLSIGPFSKFYDEQQSMLSIGSMLAPYLFHRIELRPLANVEGALSFDGVDDCVEIPTLKYDGSHPLTVEALVNSSRESPGEGLVQVCGPTWLGLAAGAGNWGGILQQPTLGLARSDLKGHRIGKSTHLAAVWDQKDLTLYVDGKRTTGSWKPLPTRHDSGISLLGAAYLSPEPGERGHYFAGTLDEIRVSKSARYLNEFVPTQRFTPDPDTLALYHCDNGRGEVLIDSSGNNHHGKVVGARWVVTELRELRGSLPAPAVAPFNATQAKQHQEAWARHLGVPVEFASSTGMKFRLIPPGEFDMGLGDGETDSLAAEVDKAIPVLGAGARDYFDPLVKAALPRRRVKLTKAYYVAETETTYSQFRRFVDDTKYKTGPERDGKGAPLFVDGNWTPTLDCNWRRPGIWPANDEDPVSQITREDAEAFCQWLSKREDGVFRLPTEAEWEFACRAGSSARFFCGDDLKTLVDHAWFTSDLKQTQPDSKTFLGRLRTVRQKLPNSLGLYDMHGGVHELCSGWFFSDYGNLPDPATNPQGPASGTLCAGRGGSANTVAPWCGSGVRWSISPTAVQYDVGFRVLREIDANPRPVPAVAPFNATQARQHQETWAKHLGVPVEYTNGVGMKFMLIPPGEFTMGSTYEQIQEALKLYPGDKYAQECIQSEAPQHKVAISQTVYLGVHEVTQEQYEKVIGHNPAHYASTGQGKDAVAGINTSKFPVENLNWYDAAEFCEKLSVLEKLPPYYNRLNETAKILGGEGYRLPYEAEWEFACRAGTVTKYSTGDGDAELAAAAWLGVNSGNRAHVVGELAANAFGLFDMHGNVYEWCHDAWDPTYYHQFASQPALNPTGPTTDASRRIARGGAHTSQASNARSSHRRSPFASGVANGRSKTMGFRVSLSVSAIQKSLKPAPTPAISPFDAAQAKQQQETWAKHLGVPVEYSNGLGMKFRLMPPGEFEMGSPDSERPREANERQHLVKLTKPFYLGQHEVTVGDFRKFVLETSHKTDAEQEGVVSLGWNSEMKAEERAEGYLWSKPGFPQEESHPVVNVSWNDAQQYCKWLANREQRPYRLPTEAEWEFAARAGTTTPYINGTDMELLANCGNVADATAKSVFPAWPAILASDGYIFTSPVGQFQPNAFGLFDMSGNVWEFVSDWFGEYPEAAVDPTGPETGTRRVSRGGSFYGAGIRCRIANRTDSSPNYFVLNYGFRVACTVEAVDFATRPARN